MIINVMATDYRSTNRLNEYIEKAIEKTRRRCIML